MLGGGWLTSHYLLLMFRGDFFRKREIRVNNIAFQFLKPVLNNLEHVFFFAVRILTLPMETQKTLRS